MRLWCARLAALLGAGASLAHLTTASGHARHEPVLTAGMLLLAVVCARCGVRLWRRPDDPVAWRDLLVLAVLMAALHLAAAGTGGGSAVLLAVPAAQVGLALVAVAAGRPRRAP